MFKLVVSSVFIAFIGMLCVESCDYKDKPCSLPYTKKMQKEMVDFHNTVRRNATPTASRMQQMYWDDTMAKMAQEHSDKCEFEHNSASERRFAGYSSVGQNLYASSGKFSVVKVAKGWYNEIKWFTYGQSTSHIVGHYTQVMRDGAARIGCGGAYCPNLGLKYLVTCNYLKGQFNFKTPYKLGKTCGECPKTCKNNLCDCGGKVCQNGGSMDINTCKCNCYKNTEGELCEKIVCDIKETWQCGYYKDYCSLYYGFKARNMCPITCGLCK